MSCYTFWFLYITLPNMSRKKKRSKKRRLVVKKTEKKRKSNRTKKQSGGSQTILTLRNMSNLKKWKRKMQSFC